MASKELVKPEVNALANLQEKLFIKKTIVLVGKNKQYRDLLEICREPATIGVLHFGMPRKFSRTWIEINMARFVKAGLVRLVDVEPKIWLLQPRGARLLEKHPGSASHLQYIIGGD